MKKDKTIGGTVIVILAILSFLAAIGFFKSAYIVPTVYGEEEFCPDYVSNTFTIKFQNFGERNTNLCIYIKSNNINITNNLSCHSMLLNRENPEEFKFDIDKDSIGSYSDIKNVTVKYYGTYKKNGWKTEIISGICNYEKKKYSNQLILIK